MHQIRREKRTTILEVIVRGQRNIKQNRNWFYFNFSVESSSFIFNKFKTKKLKFTCLYPLLSRNIIFYRKIHYLTREFRVKLHAISNSSLRDSCDIGFQVQFNVEFSSQVMNFP